MKKLLLIVLAGISTGCATSKGITYSISSTPESAPIDVNGVSVGVTPTSATLECTKKWVGVVNSPDGWGSATGKYEIKAYPPPGSGGYSQTKNIDPCQWKGNGNPSIQFDLGLESVEPTKNININANIKNTDTNTQKSLEALKTLRESGVITEEEYKKKALDLVN